ncbi:MAG: hypothetical protein GX446_19380 [Chthonomonadales bacterium]|nr:hypothetical protein [Chthonomonadales bacterium]
MSELTSRGLATIIGVCLVIVGIVGMSETILPTKTALMPSTLTVRLFGPILVALGALVLGASRRIPKKARPSAAALAATGVATALLPAAIWAAGATLAFQDSAFWVPAVAAGLLLLTVPGIGMAFGGIRRLTSAPHEAPRPSQPTTRVKRRK